MNYMFKVLLLSIMFALSFASERIKLYPQDKVVETYTKGKDYAMYTIKHTNSIIKIFMVDGSTVLYNGTFKVIRKDK